MFLIVILWVVILQVKSNKGIVIKNKSVSDKNNISDSTTLKIKISKSQFFGEGNGDPLQYSCLGNPMDRGAWQATVHGVAKESDTTEQLTQNHCRQWRRPYN